jgi:hypothetical protein
VRLSSGDVVRADIVGTTPNYDLGVIRLRNLARLPPPVDVGSSADLKVGQFAYAIGNPFGLDESLTTGVISALSRRLPTSSGREIPNAIQTDAAVATQSVSAQRFPGHLGPPLATPQLGREPSLLRRFAQIGRNSPAIRADFDPNGFRSSSPTTPAMQSVSAKAFFGRVLESAARGWHVPQLAVPLGDPRARTAFGA